MHADEEHRRCEPVAAVKSRIGELRERPKLEAPKLSPVLVGAREQHRDAGLPAVRTPEEEDPRARFLREPALEPVPNAVVEVSVSDDVAAPSAPDLEQ